MAHTWLYSVLSLSTFFRYTLIWSEVVLLPFSFLTDIGVFIPTVLAVIFNITVCALEHKAKKRTRQHNANPEKSTILPAKIWVICFDFVFAFCFMIPFGMTVASGGTYDITMRNNYHYLDSNGYDVIYPPSFSVVGAQAYAKILVVWHYHLLFAAISLHSWRRGNRDTKVKKDALNVHHETGSQQPIKLDPVVVRPKI